MNRKIKHLLGTLGWTGLLTSIISTALLDHGLIGGLEWFLILLVSLFAGAVLVEARIVLFASVASLVLSWTIVFLILISPLVLGGVGSPVLASVVSEVAFLTVFAAYFPVPILLIIFGGLVGGSLSEWLGLF